MNGVDELTMRAVYPTAPGLTVGQAVAVPAAQPLNQQSDGTGPQSGAAVSTSPAVTKAVAVASTGSPLVWLFLMIGLLVLLMVLARYTSEASEFAQIRPTFYNVLIISLAAVIGINIFKTVFTIFPVPGLTAIFMNA
jgi:hypothetical protein